MLHRLFLYISLFEDLWLLSTQILMIHPLPLQLDLSNDQIRRMKKGDDHDVE